MPKITSPLEEGGKERLKVTWTGQWLFTTVTIDDEIQGILNGVEALKEGHDFELDDGSILHIQLVKKGVKNELQILLDGKSLPDSPANPKMRFKLAYSTLFFIAILNLGFGIFSFIFPSAIMQSIRTLPVSILYSIGFAILGNWTKRRSALALILAIVIFTADSLMSIVVPVLTGTLPSTTGVIGRIFLLIPMVQGIKAIREL